MVARDRMRRPGGRSGSGLLPWYLSPANAEEIFRPPHDDIERGPEPSSAPRMLADAGGDSSPAMMEIARFLASGVPEAPARIDLSSMPGPRGGGEVNRMDLSRPQDYEPQTVNTEAKRDRIDTRQASGLPMGIAREAIGQAMLLGYGDDIEAWLTGRASDDIRAERNKFGDENPATALGSYAGGLVTGGAAPKILKWLHGLGRGSEMLDDVASPGAPRFEPDLRQAMRNVEGVEAAAKGGDDTFDALQRLLSNPEARADIQGKPMELSPADIMMMTAGAAPSAGPVGTRENPLPQTDISEHDTSGMSPIDRLRLESELSDANGGYLTEAEKARNMVTNTEALAGTLPVIGNMLSARDAFQGAENAGTAFGAGNMRGGLMHSALAALSGVGAITGLPTGKAAGRAASGASSRANIFAGIGAKTADRPALERAQQMKEAGADRADIWKETGWFQGPEGKWRFEIDDSGASMTPRAKQILDPKAPGARAFGNLGEFIDHPELAKAYPDVPYSVTTLERGAGSGAFRDWDDMISLEPRNVPEARRIGLHELQHRIQRDEGFAPGANPSTGHSIEDSWKAAREAYESSDQDTALLRDLGIDVPSGGALKPWDALTKREQLGWLERGRESLYHRTAGEVEARNVEARSAMDAEGRRNVPPWETQDVPDSEMRLNALAPGTPQAMWLPEGDQAKIADVLSRRVGDQPLRDIYRDTGGFLEPGGRVMSELSDKGMQVWPGSVKPGDEVPLGMLAEHPELFDRFPQYRDIPTTINSKVDARGDTPVFMTNPKTGNFEVSTAPGDTKRGILKLLQYRIGEDQGMPAALRHWLDIPEKLGETAGSFRAVKPANTADLDALAAYVDKTGQLRTEMLRNLEMADPRKIKNIHAKTAHGTAGNVTAANAAGRSTLDDAEREAIYPYARATSYINRSRRPPEFEDMLVLPPESASPDELLEFLRNWRKYGAGMPTGG